MLNEREQLALLNAVRYAPINTYCGNYNWSHEKWVLIIDNKYHYHHGHIVYLLDKLYGRKIDHWNSEITLTLKDVERMLSALPC